VKVGQAGGEPCSLLVRTADWNYFSDFVFYIDTIKDDWVFCMLAVETCACLMGLSDSAGKTISSFLPVVRQ
jgi:hypothetical protein